MFFNLLIFFKQNFNEVFAMQQKLVNEAQKKSLPTTSATSLQNNVCFVDKIFVGLA